jgi:hypothetical protein
MWKRKLIVTVVGLAVLVAVVALVLWPRSDPASLVTMANFDRIDFGMSRAEVEEILGPPGDYSTYDLNFIYPGKRPHVEIRGTDPRGYFAEWLSDGARIFICFDRSGRVWTRQALKVQIIDHGPFGNLLWRAKRFLPSLFQ